MSRTDKPKAVAPKKQGRPIVVGIGASAGGLEAKKEQQAVEQLASSNEELKAAHEEGLSINEEL